MYGKQLELIKSAKLGCRESENALAALTAGQLRSYIYRLTLDEHLTQDLVQESCVIVFKRLHKLKRPEAFWSWTRRIATNVVRDHYRRNKDREAVSDKFEDLKDMNSDTHDGLASVVAEEWKQAVVSAMEDLKPVHREVLVLRCYEQLDYSEIAQQTNSSEISVRMRFVRAKRSLAKKLAKRGLGKSSLVIGLALFGKMTAPSVAAADGIAVTPATMNAGVVATLAGAMCTRTALITAVAGVTIAGAAVLKEGPSVLAKDSPHLASKKAVLADGAAQIQHMRSFFYYPDADSDSFVCRRMLRKGGAYYTEWLHNTSGTYHYDVNSNIVFLNNFNYFNRDLSVVRLPTDPPNMSRFISEIEGSDGTFTVVERGDDDTVIVMERGPDGIEPYVFEHPNSMQEDYFKGTWPVHSEVIDARDHLHRKGWCTFQITGHWNGMNVSGEGRMPFVQQQLEQNEPAFFLRSDDWILTQHSGSGSQVVLNTGETLNAGQSFFDQIGQPWKGLHCVDVIRRAAARRQMPFEHVLSDNGDKAWIDVYSSLYRVRYAVRLWDDLVESIELFARDGDGSKLGELRISYSATENELDEFEVSNNYSEYDMAGKLEEPWTFWLASQASN
ncbi:RNA polymerase sigma factor SigM [Anaerohalosphaera lusitana]|uniref:RNA polymerase sigma factor SigM n=1 Tax=Anaerohalosphaera lusitana TaxID=1936003 RepID=A0A1U9NM67_9BACT|nr:sigma-70 family RNA polymerase sigma factor [Anaerohalosphaera lusitana]AQT68925.1 RNA polymerase sigma factor SigM [Anaerohalosphaera lusitana]